MQMRLWETYWKPGAPGVGPGLGFGHVHTGPARQTEAYFAERGLSDLLPPAKDSIQLWSRLLSEEGNFRYVAAEVRRLAEIRMGGQWEYGQLAPIENLSEVDLQIIMEGYWMGVGPGAFGTAGFGIEEFQTAAEPKSWRGPLILPSWEHYQEYFGR